ncbi:hypothetical protein X777_12008, partial [Ooceraea biroi]
EDSKATRYVTNGGDFRGPGETLRSQKGMDFQSAMDTFVEAWMAANTKTDQVQSQALALTHKASPPSRPSSVSSLPRSPQSHQSQQSQPQNPQTPSVHPLQSQTPLSAPQTPFSAHNQHPKQEISASPKQEGFDLSKSASSTGPRIRPAFRLVCVHTYAPTHTRTVDDGSYKRAVERLPGAAAAAGGLWQSTQGLEAKRLIPQEALHPVLIRREFYERFERYRACVLRAYVYTRSRARARASCVELHRRDIARREGDLEQGELCRPDDGRMTGKRAGDVARRRKPV